MNEILKSTIMHSKGAGLTPIPASGAGLTRTDVPRRVYHMHKRGAAAPTHSSGGSLANEMTNRFLMVR
jgi:hypothetical protein